MIYVQGHKKVTWLVRYPNFRIPRSSTVHLYMHMKEAYVCSRVLVGANS